ncbi:periplasmic negative regulator of sigmaE, partial [Vibrio cholerae NCTC 8457]
SAEALLYQMNEASQHLNYELSYILVKKNSIEPLLYRHARQDDQQLAHLVYLSGPVREVIRRGDEVSYIEPGVEPFTIESGNMVAPTIPMLNTDVAELSRYYDFVKVGRAREAGAACQVLRVVPKDGLRYSYVVWVDEKSHLPLRADCWIAMAKCLSSIAPFHFRSASVWPKSWQG